MAPIGSAAKARLYHDDDGMAYGTGTALWYDKNVPANSRIELKGIMADNQSGNIACRTDTANALTFTAYGVEIT